MFELFLKGGPLMWPILFCSIISITVILERFFYFHQARIKDKDIFSHVKELLEEGKEEEALSLCKKAKDPLSGILAIAISTHSKSLQEKEKLLLRGGSRIIRHFEKNLRALAIIANIAPLLGLLGTVTGMIKTFMKIEWLGAGMVNVSDLAGGIWEALITTAAGLTVAIPSLFFYYYFEGKVDNIATTMKDVATEFLDYHSTTCQKEIWNLKEVKKLTYN